jgi:predicted NACHT family NTPase
VEKQALMLFLDGLDEVSADRRNDCVRALNDFMIDCFTTEIVICCRIRDYEALLSDDRLLVDNAMGEAAVSKLDRSAIQATEKEERGAKISKRRY